MHILSLPINIVLNNNDVWANYVPLPINVMTGSASARISTCAQYRNITVADVMCT